jgi:hypothetical protein
MFSACVVVARTCFVNLSACGESSVCAVCVLLSTTGLSLLLQLCVALCASLLVIFCVAAFLSLPSSTPCYFTPPALY